MHKFDSATEQHEKHDDHRRFHDEIEQDGMSFEFHGTTDGKHETNNRGDEPETGNEKHHGDFNKAWEHHRVVCSRCCIEKGADGEVRCFGCLRAEGEG